MKKIKISNLLVAVALALSGMLVASGAMLSDQVMAEEGESESPKIAMTVSPPYQEIILTPGEVYKGTIEVSNPSTSTVPLKYSISIGSYSAKATEGSMDDYSNHDLTSVSSYNQIMQWINIPQNKGEVAPNNKTEVPFTITVPEDAPAGGQYASLIVQNDTDIDEQNGSNIQIESNVQIASLIYAEVTGTTKQEGEILSNSFPMFMLSGPLTATSMVQNNGNVHTDAKYTLQVWPLFSDEEICTNEEEPTTELVMPETRRYHVESCDLGPVGIFNAKQTVEIFGKVSTSSHMVVILPIWLILIVVVVIVAIVYVIMKKVKAKKVAKA